MDVRTEHNSDERREIADRSHIEHSEAIDGERSGPDSEETDAHGYADGHRVRV